MTHKKVIEKELDGFGIRLNQKPPDIVFRKKDKGGLNYQETVPQVNTCHTYAERTGMHCMIVVRAAVRCGAVCGVIFRSFATWRQICLLLFFESRAVCMLLLV